MIKRLICKLKGHKYKYHHTSQWYDVTYTPWKLLETEIAKCSRCNEMRKIK